MSRIIWTAIGLIGVLGACAQRSPQAPASQPRDDSWTLNVASGAAGPYPSNYRQLVIGAIRSTFLDPYSVRDASVTKPVEAKTTQVGWLVCLTANGKNAYGAYAGQQTFAYLIRDGAIIEAFPNRPPNAYAGGDGMVAKIGQMNAQIAANEAYLSASLCRQAINAGLTALEPLPLSGR